MTKHLVRIQFDETSLCQRFININNKFATHEEMILELKKLIRECPGNKYDELNQRISDLSQKFEDTINDLKTNFDNKLSELSDFFTIKFRQKFSEISDLIPQNNNFDNYEERINNCEEDIKQIKQDSQSTRSSVLQIASSIASLTDQNAELDETLGETMDNSMLFLQSNFQSLSEQLHHLKEKIAQLEKERENQSQKSHLSPRIESPRITQLNIPKIPIQLEDQPKTDQSYKELMDKQKQQLSQQPMIINVNKDSSRSTQVYHEISSRLPYDLTTVRPYPSVNVVWKDKPELPPIRSFFTIEEFVDYIYRIQPPLQAYLNAIHKKLFDIDDKLKLKVDQDAVHKMFQRFQGIIGEVKSHIDNLKRNLENTPSRDEINDIVEDIFGSLNSDTQSAVGRVHCIACGREITQVTGAKTELEISKTMGSPTNSIVYSSGASLSMNYDGRRRMDSGIVESPRSVRPYKQAIRGKQLKPI